MNASALFLSLPLLAALAPAQEGDAPSARRTNIVVLYSDDAGWSDFGFQPHADPTVAGRTPRIDSIAAGGARFEAAYMSGCVCSPSRAGLQTGRYQQRFGHETNIPAGYLGGGLELAERTLGDRLGALGYATGLVGKWHLGYPEPYQPNARGYAWFHGLLQGSRSYRPLAKPSAHRVIQENGVALPEAGYLTDRFGEAAARYIAERVDEPFFLFVSFTATHGPLQPTEEDLALLPAEIPTQRRKNLGLMIGLDRAVGRVLDALDEHGLGEDTLVVFTNDNGGQTQTGAVNAPLRGRKGQLYEGGIRVPMAIRWPGRIEPGTVISDPVIALDLTPTFLRVAGGAPDEAARLDGVDLLPRLTGRADRLAERRLYWRSQGSRGPIALREGDWKLVFERGVEGAGPQLYDLAADLGEEHDLAADDPERVQRLLAALATWEAELEEPRWGPGSAGAGGDADADTDDDPQPADPAPRKKR